MSKQTKQLVLLIGLVVVAGIVAIFVLSGGDDKGGTKTAGNTVAAATPTPTPAATPTPTAATAKPGTATPAKDGAAATPGAAATVPDLEMPEEAKIVMPSYKWDWPAPQAGEGDSPENYGLDKNGNQTSPPFDPLTVQNIDVVDPTRKQYIEDLKAEWKLDGIIETVQNITQTDENGKPEIGTDGKRIDTVEPVLEAWFKDKRRPYRKNDRLTGTRFTIVDIFTSKRVQMEGSTQFRVRAGVELLGDTGAKLTLYLGDDSRYPAEQDGK